MTIWKSIPNNSGYEVSDHGQIRSVDRWIEQRNGRGGSYKRFLRGKLLKWSYNKVHHYYGVTVTDDDNRHYGLRVAHAVLLTFVGERPEGLEACHNDGDPANNAVDNLRWDTRANNAADTIRHGTSTRGERHPMNVLLASEVLKIRRSTRTNAELAARYGVGERHIYKIRKRETWAWL